MIRQAAAGAVPFIRDRRTTALSLLGLTLLAFVQRPGRITFDTKLDLALNPAGLMARALHLWNPEATSGELQNQAYGYLFPMGPFFAAGQALGVPMWITQRLWCALLLCTAYLGILFLARALGLGSEPARHVGALAYALAPRMLTEIGTLSAEMLPAVLIPWAVLPLVRVRELGSPRRAAALSALAVLLMSGVNAAMVLMALVVPGLWLLTRRFTRSHVALVAWWCAGIVACALWWFLPLLLLGRYSLPFLAYIESSANTTGVVSLFQAVRGTNQWVAYVVQGVPWWPSGWMLVDNPILMAATMAVAALGLAGLAARGMPERRFVVLTLLAGLTLLTAGFVGDLDSPLSGPVRHLLDGPLAAFRNVHKFEPVLRLPVVLGLIHAVAAGTAAATVARARRRPDRPLGRWALAGPALALVVVMAAPAWLLTLRPGPGWSDVPGYWRQAASWLAARDADARTLVVPGTGFGTYTWGRTVDEPIQALAGAPWALRNQVPLGSEGNTRMMDTVEEVLAAGRGSAGLADYLARNGFRYLLLRTDVDRSRPDTPPVAVVRQTLARSPGISLAAAFGPPISPRADARGPVDDEEQPPPAIEVYEVGRPVPQVRAVPVDDVAAVSGGPESLLALLEQDLIAADRPAVLAGDLGEAGVARPGTGQWLVTDGLRRRERNVGRVRDNLSETLAAGTSQRQSRASLDILPVTGPEHLTVAVYQGVRSVNASSAASFADALDASEPSHLPFAAIDGDPTTAWHSSAVTGPQGQWLEVSLDTPRRMDAVRLQFVDDLRVGYRVTRFRLTTDHGSVDHDVVSGATSYAVPIGGLTTTLRVTVLAVADGHIAGNVGIRELSVPETEPGRALRVPVDPSPVAGPPAFAFSRGHHARQSCYTVARTIRCDPGLDRVGEEPHGVHRLFRTPVAARYGLTVTAVAAPGAPLPVPPGPLRATASSWLTGDPRVAPGAAIDGDPITAWLADVGDTRPTLSLQWTGPRRVDELTIRFAGPPVASRPTVVELRTASGTRRVDLPPDGHATFPALVTDQLDVAVLGYDAVVLDRRAGVRSEATVGFAEIDFPALADLRPPPPPAGFDLPCGQGPVVQLDGVRFKTAISGSVGDFVDGRPLPVTICDLFAADQLDLPAGEHRLHTERSTHFLIQDATLRPTTAGATPPRTRAVTVDRWGPTRRSVRIAPGEAALLVVPENANAGWRATLGGDVLAATRVDGWQQAWVVPAGSGGVVTLEFTPDRPYRQGLALGGAAALLVVLLAALPVRGRYRARPPAVAAAGGYWLTIAIVGLVAALAGVLAVVLLIAGALVRQVRPRALVPIALGGAAVAAAVAVAGRLLGHGQDWAYGPPAQAAMLVAICAGVAAGAVRLPGGADLDEGAGENEQAGGDRGGRGDLADGTVQPPPDDGDLDTYRYPYREDRPDVGARDPGEQQDLRDGEQRPGEGEDPQWGGHPGVAAAADERQQVVPEQRRAYDDRGVEAGHHGDGDPHRLAPATGVGQPGQHDDADRLG